MEQAEAEDLAQALEMWAWLADAAADPDTDSDGDLPSSGPPMLQAAAVIRRQAETIASLRRDLQRARSAERVLDRENERAGKPALPCP